MGLLDRVRKSDAPAKEPKKTTKKGAAVQASEGTEPTVGAAASKSVVQPWELSLIRQPRVTEKAARLAQQENVYTFDVSCDAEKIVLKKTIERLYKVKVVSIRTVRGDGKIVRRGRVSGTRNRWKKALVKVAPGQTIDIYASAS